MKVYIGPYKNWFGPYQLANLLNKVGVSEDRCHNIGAWLSETWVNTLLEKIYSYRKRTIYVKIDKYDSWSADHTLALITLPLLKQLQATKHGAPMVADEDVPYELKSTTASQKENDWDIDDNHFKRWDWVLNEIIWSFEQIVDEDGDGKFYDDSGVDKSQNVMDQVKQIKVDKEGLEAYNKRMANGLCLFGKYYSGLWD